MEGNPVFLFQEKNFEFLHQLETVENKDERKKCILEYIKERDGETRIQVPEYGKEWEWFNVDHSLQASDLKGKIQILDFFTYCCINCMHILPDLEELESTYKDSDGVVIIGVHSAKFDNEKVSRNILSAILRYNITHPVVNDSEAVLWHALNIQCWPTLVITNPQGEVLWLLAGEGHGELLKELISVALEHYQDGVSHEPVRIKLARNSLSKEESLLFPGKLAVSSDGYSLAVADTGHHRIVITDKSGIVQVTIGGTEPGFEDSDFSAAKFSSPQGVCWSSDSKTLFVADTNNHAIRRVDLVTREVTTIAGTGVQGKDYEGGKMGPEQAISSPWDVTLVPPDEKVLLVAMAGTHQIWTLFLQDSSWIKCSEYKSGTCVRFAGSGQEENKNGAYPQRAGFAQPSGLAVGKVKPEDAVYSVFVADSESSSIRSVSLLDGAVKAVVGGDIDPKNLFAFGDVDGKKTEARLQHPLAVAMKSRDDGPLMVADSYNHKIKVVDVAKRECRTLFGCGEPGDTSGSVLEDLRLSEPGGLSVDPEGRLLYIADTNNHKVKVFSFDTQELHELHILFAKPDAARRPVDTMDLNSTNEKSKNDVKRHIAPRNAAKVFLDPLTVSRGTELNVQLDLTLPTGHHLTEGAPSQWKLFIEDPWISSGDSHPTAGPLQEPLTRSLTTIRIQPETEAQSGSGADSLDRNSMQLGAEAGSFDVECVLYYCSDQGTCQMKGIIFNVPISIPPGRNDSGKPNGDIQEGCTETCTLRFALDS